MLQQETEKEHSNNCSCNPHTKIVTGQSIVINDNEETLGKTYYLGCCGFCWRIAYKIKYICNIKKFLFVN